MRYSFFRTRKSGCTSTNNHPILKEQLSSKEQLSLKSTIIHIIFAAAFAAFAKTAKTINPNVKDKTNLASLDLDILRTYG